MKNPYAYECVEIEGEIKLRTNRLTMMLRS